MKSERVDEEKEDLRRSSICHDSALVESKRRTLKRSSYTTQEGLSGYTTTRLIAQIQIAGTRDTISPPKRTASSPWRLRCRA